MTSTSGTSSRYHRVLQILDDAVGGPDSTFAFHGPFWRGLSRDRFVAMEVFGLPLLELRSDGGRSWSRIEVRDQQGKVNLEGVGFVDDRQGWVGGWGSADFSAGSSSASIDGGLTWTDANEIGRFINRFRFRAGRRRSGSPPAARCTSGRPSRWLRPGPPHPPPGSSAATSLGPPLGRWRSR